MGRRLPVIKLEEGDIVFTASNGILGRGIRWATRSKGESKTEANHVGLITTGGTKLNARITEALWKVETAFLFDRYHKKGTVAVFRPLNVTDGQIVTIRNEVLDHVGQRYGWWKLLLQFGKNKLGQEWMGKVMFIDDRPICSFLIALAFEKAGLTFGIEGRSADPDEMMDYCLENPGNYQPIIYPMQEI
jgi:hypothetical protein